MLQPEQIEGWYISTAEASTWAEVRTGQLRWRVLQTLATRSTVHGVEAGPMPCVVSGLINMWCSSDRRLGDPRPV